MPKPSGKDENQRNEIQAEIAALLRERWGIPSRTAVPDLRYVLDGKTTFDKIERAVCKVLFDKYRYSCKQPKSPVYIKKLLVQQEAEIGYDCDDAGTAYIDNQVTVPITEVLTVLDRLRDKLTEQGSDAVLAYHYNGANGTGWSCVVATPSAIPINLMKKVLQKLQEAKENREQRTQQNEALATRLKQDRTIETLVQKVGVERTIEALKGAAKKRPAKKKK